MTLPEEAVVDVLYFDPLGAAIVLGHFANSRSLAIGPGLLADISRNENLPTSRLEPILTSLTAAGLCSKNGDRYVLNTGPEDALRFAALMRGVGYARYRHRDLNQVEVTLSPPPLPSRLMEMLPRQGYSWARLYDTKDSLIELASQARQRFVIVSPFLDSEGLEWIVHLFDATASRPVGRILIIRGRDEKEIQVLKSRYAQMAERSVRIATYAIDHDPTLRSPTLETFHAKILLADSDKAYIGSANMNRWSRDYSMECGVIIRGPCVKPVATLVDAVLKISDEWSC